MDGQLSTIFAPGAVTESGGYLQYLISEDNDISSVKILQESGSVCDAAVKVQTADGQWHELGALDMAVSVFDTAGLGASRPCGWSGSPAPLPPLPRSSFSAMRAPPLRIRHRRFCPASSRYPL